MAAIAEDSPLASEASIGADLARLVRDAAERAARRLPLAESVRPLLRGAVELVDGERAFLLERGAARGERPLVVASVAAPDAREPSRSIALRALAATRACGLIDVAADARSLHGPSVRGLELRTVIFAPLRCVDGRRRALLVDSRRPPPDAVSARLAPFETLAALIALAIDAAAEREPSSGPAPSSPPPDETGTVRVGFDDTPQLARWIATVAGASLPVLIRGESGSGKERVARAIHELGARRGRAFVAVNCAAVHESLLDAELFGARRGSYTGADADRPGLLRAADGGTLFLDEIGDMPPAMQARLLRALQERRIRAVGDTLEQPIDVRVVAATHRDLRQMIAEGRFRPDLYYRIATLEVHVPPLRERPGALPRLVQALAPRLTRETGWGPPAPTPAAWRALRRHDWPGNVRELHAVLARASLRAAGAPLEPRHLDLPGAAESDAGGMEVAMIRQALRRADGGMGRAAALIGWTRQKLYRRMRCLGIPRAIDQPSPAGMHSSASSTFQ